MCAFSWLFAESRKRTFIKATEQRSQAAYLHVFPRKSLLNNKTLVRLIVAYSTIISPISHNETPTLLFETKKKPSQYANKRK